ncbi:MAG: T9SS type A sorting domain-containing protein [Crocinitomicaceae bacterium]|nr:T9SS type A sorting domain-containing protein [Crocinitomicaceae bacterium]
MKQFILLTACFFVTFTVTSQSNPPSFENFCEVPDSVLENFQNDAALLTLRKIHRQNLTYQDSVLIPQSHADTILFALAAIYNSSSLERDTILNIHQIRANYWGANSFFTGSFHILADTNLPWMIQLRNNVFPTGTPMLDSIFLCYNLLDYNYYDYSPQHLLEINLHDTYNVPAFQSVFDALNQGVVISTSWGSGSFNQGTNIFDTINSDFIKLTFQFGWGDCWAGCMHNRFWVFKVHFDCSVEFIESYGDSYLSKGELEIHPFSVSPNPSSGQFNINLDSDEKIEYLQLISLDGRIVDFKRSENENSVLLDGVAPGVYSLKIRTNLRNGSVKLVVE